ncbi:hypothetical protein [Xenophilus sp. Marseille-Q4582]|uniref:hypothetical protein n=1 Tax=Xenophilus sp. Marseille-Q4582 TaxID=2866600 RepID=UPI001CE47241|nr:hypothetical protein [Xenophilus sp. Marseille-Q4582]
MRLRRGRELLRSGAPLRGLAGLLLTGAALLGAAVHAQDLSAHAAAGARFEALRSAQPHAMPRLADPQAAQALRTLGDVARFLPAHMSAQLPAVADTCGRVRDAVLAYQSFGALQDGQLSPQRLLDNGATYQEELGLLQPFLAHCIARQVPLAEAALQQIDPRMRARLRLGGLQRGQATVMQLYASLSAALADPRVQPAQTQALLAALADTAGVHVRALTLENRHALRAMADEHLRQASADGPMAPAWRRIEQALADERCAALCELAASSPAR